MFMDTKTVLNQLTSEMSQSIKTAGLLLQSSELSCSDRKKILTAATAINESLWSVLGIRVPSSEPEPPINVIVRE
jgi:hypothetical protein